MIPGLGFRAFPLPNCMREPMQPITSRRASRKPAREKDGEGAAQDLWLRGADAADKPEPGN